MKLLFVVPNYEPAWSFGGVMRCMSTLCRGLQHEGVDVTVYTTNLDGKGGTLAVEPGEYTSVGGVSVYYFPSTFGSNSDFDSRALARKMEASVSQFDLVYIAAMWQWIGVSASKICSKHSVPYVHGSHGSFGAYSLAKGKAKKSIFLNLFMKKHLIHADAIHVTTEYERASLKVLGDRIQSFIVPNSIPDYAFTVDETSVTEIRQELKISASSRVIIFAGRPDPVKRLDIVIKALPEILTQVPDAHLLIVGSDDNEYSANMKKLVSQLELESQVTWAGFIAGEKMPNYYAAADLFALPSMGENFGMVVAEAMATGTPVVISDCVGVSDDVEHYGAGIVTSIDPKQVSNACVELLQNRKGLKDMGSKAKEMAQSLYGSGKVAGLALTAFRDVLNHTKSKICQWN
ncbi:MAG: glycosyltransferase [Bacteroidales bacterium]|nr:glycosyltransferase [Bacteroidales bacterium]